MQIILQNSQRKRSVGRTGRVLMVNKEEQISVKEPRTAILSMMKTGLIYLDASGDPGLGSVCSNALNPVFSRGAAELQTKIASAMGRQTRDKP